MQLPACHSQGREISPGPLSPSGLPPCLGCFWTPPQSSLSLLGSASVSETVGIYVVHTLCSHIPTASDFKSLSDTPILTPGPFLCGCRGSSGQEESLGLGGESQPGTDAQESLGLSPLQFTGTGLSQGPRNRGREENRQGGGAGRLDHDREKRYWGVGCRGCRERRKMGKQWEGERQRERKQREERSAGGQNRITTPTLKTGKRWKCVKLHTE